MIQGEGHVLCLSRSEFKNSLYLKDNIFFPYLRDYYMYFNVLWTYYRFSRGAESSGKGLRMYKGHAFLSRSEF